MYSTFTSIKNAFFSDFKVKPAGNSYVTNTLFIAFERPHITRFLINKLNVDITYNSVFQCNEMVRFVCL